MFFTASEGMAERELAPGVRTRLLWGERIMMSFVDFQPGAVVPSHQHPHEQMGMVLKGEFELVIGDEARLIKEGDAFWMPSNVEHSGRAFSQPALVLDVFSPPREDYKQ